MKLTKDFANILEDLMDRIVEECDQDDNSLELDNVIFACRALSTYLSNYSSKIRDYVNKDHLDEVLTLVDNSEIRVEIGHQMDVSIQSQLSDTDNCLFIYAGPQFVDVDYGDKEYSQNNCLDLCSCTLEREDIKFTFNSDFENYEYQTNYIPYDDICGEK